MNPTHDPRPAARYQAVTSSTLDRAPDAREPATGALPVAASGARVLRRVRTQVIRLALPG